MENRRLNAGGRRHYYVECFLWRRVAGPKVELSRAVGPRRSLWQNVGRAVSSNVTVVGSGRKQALFSHDLNSERKRLETSALQQVERKCYVGSVLGVITREKRSIARQCLWREG